MTTTGAISSLSPTIRPALFVGGAAIVVLAVCAFFDPFHALRAYLFVWLVCLGIALGSMALVMMHHLTGGDWGWLVRRPAEAAGATLPLLTLGFVPIAIGAHWIYPWADPAAVAASAVLRHRANGFGVPFVLGRSFAFLLIWTAMAWLLSAWSLRHDRSPDARLIGRLRQFGAFGLVVYFITMSFASVDWIASREPDWYSSTFGLVTITGQAVTALAALIVVAYLLIAQRAQPLSRIVTTKAVHDLGNLLQTLVVFWAYVSFAQYLVIWSGNTQEDLIWFHHRTTGGWRWIGISLITLHFGLPFVLLLFQRCKRELRSLAMIAAFVLLMRVIEMEWAIAPSTAHDEARGVHWFDFVALPAVGGLWWAYWAWQIERRPLVPLARRLFVPEAGRNDVATDVPTQPVA